MGSVGENLIMQILGCNQHKMAVNTQAILSTCLRRGVNGETFSIVTAPWVGLTLGDGSDPP